MNTLQKRGRVIAKVMLAVAIGLPLLIIGFRRAEITDPAVISTMPLKKLRNSELRTFIRAAFRNAKGVTIQSRYRSSASKSIPPVVVSDHRLLVELADTFGVGSDNNVMPQYPYPGLTYVRILFNGPYKPDFEFAGGRTIYVLGGPSVDVSTNFSRRIGELLSMDENQ